MILCLLLAELSSRTPILTYHDIIPVRTKTSLWFDCSVQELKDQLAWMKKRGAVFVSTKTVYEALRQKKNLPKHSVCITFADNYAGFYQYAWPILRKEKVPVTQFVHTGFVGSPVGRPKMTWEQLIELDKSGLVTIASQTVSHPADLTKMTNQQIIKEFTNSRDQLRAELGHDVVELAYPNGKYNDRVASMAKLAGYLAAYTEDCSPAETAPNLFEIPRYVHTKYRQAWQSQFRHP